MKNLSFDEQQSTASKVWALAAAGRGAELLRGGQCSVASGLTYEVTLRDGRVFRGCGTRQEGDSLVLVLCDSSYGVVELWTTMENLAGEPLPLTADAPRENLAT